MGRPRLDHPNYRLERNERGIWTILWTEDRVSRSLSTRTRDEAQARQFFDQYLAGLESEPIPDNPTVGKILDHYTADREGHVSSKGHDWACKAIRRHIGNLRPEHLERRTYWKKRQRDGVSAGTIIKEVGHLRAALALAVKDNLIPKPPQVDRPPAPPARDVWITKEEARRLLAGATAPHIRLFIILGLATGGRKEAIESLTWDRVDLDRGLVHLALPGRPTSKKRAATVPIDPDVVEELRKQRKVRTVDYVIEWRGEPVGDVKKGFAAAVKRAKLRPEITPHVLRHSVATWMIEDGIPDEEVARFLGDTPEMVRKVYGHHRPEYLRRASASLSLRGTGSQTV